MNLVGLRATDEGYNHTNRRHWKIVPDGSLNNGFEVVSPPLEGCEGLEAVRAAITALDDAGATVDRACGLHVHFDAADLSAAEIKMIVLRYARFEREIDRFIPPSRRANNNRYCQSIAGFTRRAGWATTNTIGDLASPQQVDLCRLVEALSGEHLPEVTVNRWATGKSAVPPLVMAWLALWQRLPEAERSTIRSQTTKGGGDAVSG